MIKIQNLDVELTTKCNLKCPYCYLGTNIERKDMSSETIDLLVKFIEKFGKGTSIAIFGGEPLIVLDKVKELINKTNKIASRYTILSNGTIGNEEIQNYVKENHIRVQRSVDGCLEAQEISRKGTYDTIKDKSKFFYKGIFRRMTIIPETAKYLHKSFIEQVKDGARNFIMWPVYEMSWSEEQLNEFCSEMWKIGYEIIKHYKQGRRLYFQQISKCSTHSKENQVFCNKGKSSLAINYEGYVFLCHRLTREPKDSPFCLGHMSDILNGKDKGFNEEITKAIEMSKNRIMPERCIGCPAKNGCFKGCYAVGKCSTGNITKMPDTWCRIWREGRKIAEFIDTQLPKDWYLKNAGGKNGTKKNS